MRNLQKILALVLALVMSLSLMATAGARDFTDGDQIDETFAESVDVLTGLEVFQGYPTGDFQPKGDITRAEVAAIIYRIATGDVDDTQVKIYADYNKFSDVPSDNWAAGYINYCANAEYIKGRGDGKFYPQDKVTGYEALAMILRVVGYDKNGEFTGADWQVQTAATANQRKVTQNVNAGTLGTAATRETVAELLCKAILIEKVNYTLAFGYQISTNPEDTIAYETFKMERLTGVVTGNEIADLKETSPMAAGQTRMVIDGNERTLNVTSGLEDIGKSVRVYVRPQSGTTRYDMVTADVYATELNKVYDSFAPVSSVGNSTGSEQGINSIVGAEHFVNYDFVNRWTANIRITYAMDVHWTDYQAFTMLRENGGDLWSYDASQAGNKGKQWSTSSSSPNYYGDAASWNTQFTTNNDYTFVYEKTIKLDEMLTSDDYSNLYSIFTDADQTVAGANNWLRGAVYVGTASFAAQDDISDEIRWTDFVNTYLVNEDNRAQVESNGRGNRLIIIDNDDDGIAEYVLQTIYTIGKVSSDVKHVDTLNQKLYDSENSDAVNSTVTGDTLVSVSGKELAKSEDTLAAGDVVIFALIDGNIRAQKAEVKTEKVNTVNRAGKTITVVGEDAATYNESAVHTHTNGLTFGVNGMAGNTTYTMYFDLDGNMAAYTEGANGGLVLITNGWYNSTIGGSEFAVQAYLDGSLQTVNVGASGAQFINRTNNNNWNQLRNDFGRTDGVNAAGPINGNPGKTNTLSTIVANLDGNTLTPVDLAYFYSQNLRILDMVDNVRPGQNNVSRSWGIPYQTVGRIGNTYVAYNQIDATGNSNRPTGDKYENSFEVRGLASTVYYVVYRAHGTDTMTNGGNVVVRQYTGSAPNLDNVTVEDVYAVGAKATTATNQTYYTAQMVVIEVSEGFNRLSRQVFIPDFAQVSNNVGIEDVTMIDENGEKITVQVDMANSLTYDWYNVAEDTTVRPGVGTFNRTRLPGLYFMDPSDTNPDVYVVERMSPADIRNSNYLVGFVEESVSGNNGTLTSRYPQIELKVRPVNADTGSTGWVNSFGSNSNVALAKNTRPLNPGGTDNKVDVRYQGKTVTDNSKLYTYGGTTATLLEDSDYNVFAQYRQDNAGTTISGLNERWNYDPATDTIIDANDPNAFSQPNRNEVLVRYNSSGNIIWAVSFNENTDAQRVWWNCLPLDADEEDPTVPTVSFYGQPVTPDADGKFIATVPYATALANKALDPNAIVVNNGDVVPGSSNVTALATGSKTYKGTIRTEEGTYYTYELTQAGMLTVGPLESSDPSLVKIPATDTWAPIDPSKLSVASLKKILSAKNATIEIDARDSKGTVIDEDSADTMLDQCTVLDVYKVAPDGTRTKMTRGTVTTYTVTFNQAEVTVKANGTELVTGQKVPSDATITMEAKTGYEITALAGFTNTTVAAGEKKTATRSNPNGAVTITCTAITKSTLTYNPDHVTVVVGADNTVIDSGAAGTAVANGANVYVGTKLRVTPKTGFVLSDSTGGGTGYDNGAYNSSGAPEGGTLTMPGSAFTIKSEAKTGFDSPAIIEAVEKLQATNITVYTNGSAVATSADVAYANAGEQGVNIWATADERPALSSQLKLVLEGTDYTVSASNMYNKSLKKTTGVTGEDTCVYDYTVDVAILLVNADGTKTDTLARAKVAYKVIMCDKNVPTWLANAKTWILDHTKAIADNGWAATQTDFASANPHVTATVTKASNGTNFTYTATVTSKGNAEKTDTFTWQYNS